MFRASTNRFLNSAKLCLLAILISFSACKKDKTEEIPVVNDCPSVTPATTGNLTVGAGGAYTFETHGGGKIEILPPLSIRITHAFYPGFKIEFWGTSVVNGIDVLGCAHENLNSKHIKDRLSSRRTIIFPDSSKITMVAAGDRLQLLSVIIFDRAESHQINSSCGKLQQSSTSAAITQQLDDAEPDGEAGGFAFTTTGLIFFNQYTEDVAGVKVQNRYNLGEIYYSDPNRVDDYYP